MVSRNTSSSTPFDSRKYQEQQIGLLKERFPALESEALEDILAAVDWNVHRATEVLQEDNFWIEIEDDICLPPTSTPSDSNNLFLEITQSQQPRPGKLKQLPMEDRERQSRPRPDNCEDVNADQVFPALPSSSGLNFNGPIRNTSVHSPQENADGLFMRSTNPSYSPPKKPMTVYNALQDSAPWFRLHKSPWNTEFNSSHMNGAGSNGEILSSYVPEPQFKSEVRHEDTEVIHHDDLSTRTDGEDWFSLQLEPEFVYKLFNIYSNPFGAMDVGRLLLEDLNIRIPPKLAFELFRYLCLGLLQKMPEESNGSSPSDSFNDDLPAEFLMKTNVQEGETDGDAAAPDLRRIMELEMRLQGEEADRVKSLRSKLQSNLATKLTVEHLQSTFPSLSLSIIEACFVENNSRFEETVQKLRRDFPDAFMNHASNSISQDKVAFHEAVRSDLAVLKESARYHSFPTQEPNQTPTDLRLKAQTHYYLMREYAQKRAECCHAPGIADYYSEMSRLHYESMQQANRLASDMIFAENNGQGKPADHIDLHHLTVQEALKRLAVFLHERETHLRCSGRESLELKIVCGRGKHSDVHGPKLGPAIMRHLHSRGYNFQEALSGGFISVTIIRSKNYRPRNN